MSDVNYHAWTHRAKIQGGTDPIKGLATLHIKVFPDEFFDVSFPITFGDGKFIFDISEDMDGFALLKAEAYVTTVSAGGDIVTGVRNNTQSENLAEFLTVDEGERNSGTSAVTATLYPNRAVDWMDECEVFVEAGGEGTDAFGLGVILVFG